MAYRTILIELVDDVRNESRIECACDIASHFEAELVGIHVTPPPFVPVGYGEGAAYVGPEIFEAQREANRLVRERMEASFRRIAGAARLPLRDIYEEGDPGQLIAEAARTVDLTIAAQSSVGGVDALIPQPIDQVILGAGGPVLMLPPDARCPVGGHVLVAWNGSREAARSLKDALPFCIGAESVTIYAGGEDAAATLEAAAALLRRHAIEVRTETAATAGASAGTSLLEVAAVHRADLMVMGAYGHSRLREIVLGGATREVLRQTRTPVLFSS